MKQRFLQIFALCVGLLLLLPGCGSQEPARRELYAMDTFMTLQLWGPGGEAAADRLQASLQEMESRLSVTRSDSLTARLNEGETVTLSDQEAALLRETLALSQRTGGALDPCLYPVTKLWGFTTGEYRVPEAAEIQAALALSGADRLTLDGNSASLDPGAQLDLGAVVKGWAGRTLAASLAEREDVTCALLVLGGNVQTFGTKQDGSPWRIGIQDPASSGQVGLLSLTGSWAIVTSGGYQRYFEEDGVHYCHIMDPATGCPADAGLASVTVIAEDGLLADGLSTALYVMGLDRAADFWRENRDFEAVFITDAGQIYATTGAAACLSQCTFETLQP